MDQPTLRLLARHAQLQRALRQDDVKDVARANILAMQSDVCDDVFNVGSGIETSLRELCTMLCQGMGYTHMEPEFAPVRRVNPVTRRLAAVDHAREAFGFAAEVSLRQGLSELIEWHTDVVAAQETKGLAA